MLRPSHNVRMGVVVGATLVALGLVDTVGAESHGVDLVVDSGEVQLTTGSDGAKTAKVTLSNVSARRIGVRADLQPHVPGCSVTASPDGILSGDRTEIELRFPSGCPTDAGADVRLSFSPADVTPQTKELTVGASTDTHANWDIVKLAFVISLLLALLVIFGVAVWIADYNAKAAGSGKQLLEWNGSLQMETSWSFKDNWVSSVTLGATALVAVLATSGVLEAVLGAKPKAALGLIAVLAAISSVFVTLGPLVLKLIGPDFGKPTINGMLVAGAVTLTGTLGQIVGVTWQAADLTSDATKVGVIVLGALVGSVVAAYGGRALCAFAVIGTKPPPSEPGRDDLEASILSASLLGRTKPARVVGVQVADASPKPNALL